jgi:hypothetical protein
LLGTGAPFLGELGVDLRDERLKVCDLLDEATDLLLLPGELQLVAGG